MSGIAKIFDVLVNGRPSHKPEEKRQHINWDRLIANKVSHVAYKGNLYRIEVMRVVLPEKQEVQEG